MGMGGRGIRDIIHFLKTDRSVRIFLAILFFGMILRYYGLNNAENTDEYNEVFEALRVASGKFNLNRWHKKGFQNILAIEYGFYFVIGYFFQIFKDPMDFAAKIIRDMEPLFLIGRYTTATMGTLSIVLIYAIGRKIYNSRIALIAAALFAVNSIHVWTSHLVNTDIPLTFFFLISLYFICCFYESGKPWDYAMAAFFGAVTINMKVIGVGIGFLFFAAHFMRCKNDRKKFAQGVWSKEILYSTVAFILGLIISNPAIIFGLKQWIMSFIWQYGIYINVYDEVPYAIGGNAYYTYFLLLFRETGLFLFLITMVSLIYAFYKGEAWDYIFLIFIVGLFLILANTSFLVQERYLMTLFPPLCLLTARLLDSWAHKIPAVAKTQAVTVGAISFFLIAYPLAKSVKYVISLTDENTSKVSKRWIEENIPVGSKLLVDAGRTIITAGPRLSQSRERLEEQVKVIRNLKEGETYDSPQVKIVDSYSSIYFELLLKNMPEITYDITTTELARNVETIDYYKENGFEYFIYNQDLNYRVNDSIWREKYPKSAAFYESIDKSFTLIKTFYPSTMRSGPIIKIYRIKGPFPGAEL